MNDGDCLTSSDYFQGRCWIVLIRQVVWPAAERGMMGLKHAEIGWSQPGVGLVAAGGVGFVLQLSPGVEHHDPFVLCRTGPMCRTASDTRHGERSAGQGWTPGVVFIWLTGQDLAMLLVWWSIRGKWITWCIGSPSWIVLAINDNPSTPQTSEHQRWQKENRCRENHHRQTPSSIIA